MSLYTLSLIWIHLCYWILLTVVAVQLARYTRVVPTLCCQYR